MQVAHRLVEIDHERWGLELDEHRLHLGLGLAVGDQEPRARVTGAKREILRAEQVRAGNGDRPETQRAEQERVPFRLLADSDEDAVASLDADVAEQVGPVSGEDRQLGEREATDDVDVVDEGQRPLVGFSAAVASTRRAGS